MKYTSPPANRTQVPRGYGFIHLVAYAVATVVAVGIFILVPRAFAAGKNARLGDIIATVTTRVFAAQPKLDATKLQADIQAVITAHPNLTIGVGVVDVSSGAKVSAGSSAPFVGASTTKVITALAYLKNVESGRASLSQKLAGYPAEWQLKQMLNQSNNASWMVLSDKVGLAQLQAYSRSVGLSSYDVKDNSVTALEDASLLAQLQQGKLLNESNTGLLLSYLQKTNNEDMIPFALTRGATVYHKYGQLDGYIHDTAIITSRNRTFTLSIYTTGADGNDYLSRVQVIREITRAVEKDISG